MPQFAALERAQIYLDASHSKAIVRQDLADGLELVRNLAQFHEPDMDARNLDDMLTVLNPPGAWKTSPDFRGLPRTP